MRRVRSVAAWALVDQVLSSGSNLLLPLIGLARLNLADAGRLSLALSVVFLAIGVARGVVGESFVVYASREDAALKSALHRRMLGLALVLGGAQGVALAAFVVGYLHGGLLSSVFVGGMLAAVIVQDAARYAFFELSRPDRAAWNDLLWLVGFVVTAAVIRPASPVALLACWCGTGAFAGGVALLQLRVIPRPLQAVDLLRAHARTSWKIAVEFMVTSGVPQVLVGLVAISGALGASASYRLATTLLTPVGVVAGGICAGLQPIVLRSTTHREMRRLVFASWALPSVVLALCVAVIELSPTRLGVRWLGVAFPNARPLVVLLAIASLALNGCSAFGMELRARSLLGHALAVRAGAGLGSIVVAGFVVSHFAAKGAGTVFMVAAWATLIGFMAVARQPFDIGDR